MRKNKKAKLNFKKASIILAILVVAILVLIYYKTMAVVINNDYGTYHIWNGSDISSSFDGGSGTNEDPYQINTGATLMYLKTLLESEDYEEYNSLSYILTSNINMDNHAISTIGDMNHPFSGTLNGNGYSIANLLFTGSNDTDYYYGLFAVIDNASIKNINLKNINYNINLIEEYENLYVGSISAVMKGSTISNVGIYTMNVSCDGIVGGLVGYQTNNSIINNVYINAEVSGDSAGIIIGISDTNDIITNALTYGKARNDDFKLFDSSSSYNNYQNIYTYRYSNNVLKTYRYLVVEEELTYEESNENLNTISTLFTNNISEFTWHVESPYIRFDNVSNVTLYIPSTSYIPATFSIHESGIIDNKVYINDMEKEWNYYLGLNYTTSDGTLPTLENKKIYDETNLVHVQLSYFGYDYKKNVSGYISIDERQNELIYYRTLPINNNGTDSLSDDYILIELIDNPFTDRPNNSAFNGWITNYPDAYISYDSTTYQRYVKVPVAYRNSNPKDIAINMYAAYAPVTLFKMSTSTSWSTAFSNLKAVGMEEIHEIYEYTYLPYDMTGYYEQVLVARNSSYAGLYNSSGTYQNSGTCRTNGGCTYYRLIQNENYDSSKDYYELVGTSSWFTTTYSMQAVNPNNLDFEIDEVIPIVSLQGSMAGFYEKQTLSRGNSLVGLYDASGNIQKSGTCNSNSCTYYKLIQFYDDNGNVNLYNSSKTYYYLVTRDTNIILMDVNISSVWASGQNKPFTLTSVYNGEDYRNNAYLNYSSTILNCYADTTIENIILYSGKTKSNNEVTPPTSTSTSSTNRGNIYARWHNVKIGRGIVQYSANYTSANNILAGYFEGVGSQSSPKKYKLIVESGVYNTISLTGGATSSYTSYIEMQGVYGSDYDRVTSNNNNLDVVFCASGQWGSNLYASSNTGIITDLTVKSGKFGSSKYNYTAGIYVGGRSYGNNYAARKATIYGGYIYNLIGGPLTATSQASYNDTYIYMLGGEVDMIIGGAGTSATYGNRILQLTGGKVNYSVFGGSNGYQGSNGEGTLNGSSYVYIGGDIEIGNPNNLNATLYGAEAGSVFGIGNGRSGNNYTSIGSNDNSNIIITGDATINRNVYGGGNYGATGVSSSYSTTTSNINVIGGHIKGDIYGGGNNNGSGSSSKVATINIMMSDGIVDGSIYGGSNQLGTIYGNVNLYIYGGKATNVYGGGKGGYRNNSSTGTFVERNINVFIGDNEANTYPNITGSIYGGSAYGTVNGTTRNNNLSIYETSVTVNGGSYSNVYGGSQGDSTYSPYVLGNINVNINGGNITNVYGGNDAAGYTNGNVALDLNGGVIENAYGGGNAVNAQSSDVELKGSTVTNIYGGGNNAGINSSSVILTSGEVTNVYGGSNSSGTVVESNITNTVIRPESPITPESESNDTFIMDVSVSNTDIRSWGWQSNTISDITVTLTNNGHDDITLYDVTLTTKEGTLYSNNSSSMINNTGNTYTFDEVNRYYGTNIVPSGSSINITFQVQTNLLSNEFDVISYSVVGYDSGNNRYEYPPSEPINPTIDEPAENSLTVTNIYGGNNAGGVTNNTNITLNGITVTNIYGGGNNADVTGSTNLDLEKVVATDIFGGGNNGKVSGNTLVDAKEVTASNIYGGGNLAGVIGSTHVIVSDNSEVSNSVFGGGNAGAVGTQEVWDSNTDNTDDICQRTNNNATTTVDILGGSIGKNVYGGCNTSKVCGVTYVNIGSTNNGVKSTINIGGTIFGGGEANADGSETYNFDAKSVSMGSNLNINGSDYNTLGMNIRGSIFGSGNASSIGGNAYINIESLGTRSDPNTSISIQRANEVVISNSTIELEGITDRTNEYDSIKYSISRVELLKIKNNTTLLVQQDANMLAHLQSLVDIDGHEVKASVSIGDTFTRNVDNRIYIIANKSMNVTTNENADAYGIVEGMTFFGMYTKSSAGTYRYGIYGMQNNDSANAGDVITGSAYILGLHAYDMNYEIDGFYSNYIDEDYTKVTSSYVIPTEPEESAYYWAIGLSATNYSFTLTASKYSSLGTYELAMREFSSGNTTFTIMGFNIEELVPGVNLVDSAFVPKIAATPTLANQTIGLSMKAETTEWTSANTTKFLSSNGGTFTSTSNNFVTDNQATTPYLTFYLYHAKNITLEDQIGTVVVTLQAMKPINEIESELSLIVITIDLDSKVYQDEDSYDASITYGKKYEMPSVTSVNITNDSQFTAYYGLFAPASNLSTIYGNNNDKYHVLTSDYALPVGTAITMIDISLSETDPEYYYFEVDSANYNSKVTQISLENEATYNLSEFIRMGSTSHNNRYSDSIKNQDYYRTDAQIAVEEFLFIFDFKNTNLSTDIVNNSILLELRTHEDRTSISVLGILQSKMKYSLYEVSNVTLESTLSYDNGNVYVNSPKNIGYKINVRYDQTAARTSIIDTNYEASSMGINISVYDNTDTLMSSSLLSGASIIMDGKPYFASSDGIFRIKLANKVSNLNKNLILTMGSTLPSGLYNLEIDLFASNDGLHSSKIDTYDIIPIKLIGNDNYINTSIEDSSRIINGENGLNLNDLNEIKFNIEYSSSLSNPNIRLVVYKRDIDNYDTRSYSMIDLRRYVASSLARPSTYSLTSSYSNEYIVTNSPTNNIEYSLLLNEEMTSGTYKFVFELYDNNFLVDSSSEYIIVKKGIESE